MPSSNLSISDAALLLGVTTATLRNWDRSGKLVPERNAENGYRRYPLDAVMGLVRDGAAAYAPRAEEQGSLFLEDAAPDPRSAPRVLDARALRLLVGQMNSAFRDSQGGGLLERFEEVTKLLYAKLYDERRSPDAPRFVRHAEPAGETHARVAALYDEAVGLLPDVALSGRRSLGDDVEATARVVGLLQNVDLAGTPADVKGIVYEELVRNTFEKSENQQFFTPRTVVQFLVSLLSPQPGESVADPACGSGGFLIEAATQRSAASSASSGPLVGFEVDRRMAWVAQMNLVMHGDGDGRVHYLGGGGSLAPPADLAAVVPPGGFDLILTNPPFGSDLSDPEALQHFRLGRGRTSRRRGALFVERCIAWLRPGGRLGIVIDDSVLNGDANADVRRLLLEQSIVEAVVSLPDVTFMPYATAKASVVVVRKRRAPDEAQGDVFMADVEHVGRKPNGDPLYASERDAAGHLVLRSDLPGVLDGWERSRLGEPLLRDAAAGPAVFTCAAGRIERTRADGACRLDVPYHHPSREVAEAVLQTSAYPTPTLGSLVAGRADNVIPAHQDPDGLWRYVGLAGIEARTGGYAVQEALGYQIKSAVRRFCAGDIVFAKLRPELRKCALIGADEEDGFVSSECFVLRTLHPDDADPLGRAGLLRRESSRFETDPAYLALMLRSDVVFGQLVYQVSGVGRPRVSRSAVLGLRIPLPPLSVQREIVQAHKAADSERLDARRRSEAALKEGGDAIRAAYDQTLARLCG